MPLCAGVDGCRGGWFVVLHDPDAGEPVHCIAPCFADVLALVRGAEVVALDMPIGLLAQAIPGGRTCDIEARALLGYKRARSVFSPPVRQALAKTSFREAAEANRASSCHRIGISRQCFGLFHKLREVDRMMTPQRQRVVKEAHPELCFFALNGKTPMRHSKHTQKGQGERLSLLLDAGFDTLPGVIESYWAFRAKIAPDDILDAHALCWTAARIFRSEALRIPQEPPCDERGLRMEIWA